VPVINAVIIAVLTFLTYRAQANSSKFEKKSFELSKFLVQKEEREKEQRELERVKYAVQKFENMVINRHADVLNKGKGFENLFKDVSDNRTIRNYVDLRDDFTLPLPSNIIGTNAEKYKNIREFYIVKVLEEPEGKGLYYAFMKDYLGLLKNLGLDKAIFLKIKEYVDNPLPSIEGFVKKETL
jgi:hypothetical protein